MTQELIISTTQGIANQVGALPGQVRRFQLDADKAENVLQRAVIKTEKNAEDATTFIKSLTTTIDDANEVRLTYTRPLDTVKKTIKDQFDESVARLAAVKDEVNKRLTVWLKNEKARKEAEALAEIERQTAEARRIADAMRAAGDDDDAEDVEALAAQLPQEAAVVRVEGTFGGGAGLQERISGIVDEGANKLAFITWAAACLNVDDLAQINIGKRLLNTLAGKVHRKELSPIPGLTVVSDDRARVA